MSKMLFFLTVCSLSFTGLEFKVSKKLKLSVSIQKIQLENMEPIPLTITLENTGILRKKIFQLVSSQTLGIEMRKQGATDWTEVLIIDVENGTMREVDFSAGFQYLNSKESVHKVISIAPWLHSREEIVYPYKEADSYQIRASFFTGRTRIYSNIVSVQVGSFDPYKGRVRSYLEKIDPLYFLYDYFTFEKYLAPSEQSSLDEEYLEHIQYIISNFPDSSIADWAKLYFLGCKIFYKHDIQSKLITIEKDLPALMQDENPFIRGSAKFLSQHNADKN